MGAFVLDSANKIKGVALAVAIALHGVAGFGVANMQIKTLTPPKITPPLEVEFIKPEPKPEPEKIILNNLESPEPVVVNQPVQQQVARKQEAGAMPPKPAKMQSAKPIKTEPAPAPEPEQTKPETEPKKSELIPEPEPEHQIPPEPDTRVQDELLQQQAQQAAFEAEQRRLEHERLEREQLERERLEHIARQEQLERERLAKEQAQKEQLAKEQAERERKQREAQEKARAEAEAAARRQAEADALAKKQADEARRQAQQGQGQGNQGDGKDKKNVDGKKGGKDDNNQQGQIISGQNLGSISNASWIRKPNFSGIHSDEIKGNVSVTATLTIDAKGSITGVSGVSTGDRELDKQIMREIRRAKLKPFKQGNNTLTGTATYPISIKLSN